MESISENPAYSPSDSGVIIASEGEVAEKTTESE